LPFSFSKDDDLMTVRAKFRVKENKQPIAGQSSITLEPVTGGSEENDSFFKYTPGGKILLEVVNPAAAEQFVVGADFYVDFTPASIPEAATPEASPPAAETNPPAGETPPAATETPAPQS
jgi:hypothetical protein